MLWFTAIAIVLYIGYRFFSDVRKDKDDLFGKTLAEKFEVIVSNLNQAAFNGNGKINPINSQIFTLYEEDQNQLLRFVYGTGHLTITWYYKYYQKEVAHERLFTDVRNLSIFEQQRIAESMVMEMKTIIENHQRNVLGG